MKIEVDKLRQEYILKINEEEILRDYELGVIVDKIEEYLKMRFIKEIKNNKFLSFFER